MEHYGTGKADAEDVKLSLVPVTLARCERSLRQSPELYEVMTRGSVRGRSSLVVD